MPPPACPSPPACPVAAGATITGLAAALAAGTVTAAGLVDRLLERIARHDPALRAFVALTADRARADAAASDVRRAAGATLGPLDGIPYAAKDLLDVAGVPTGAGTRLLADAVAAADCAAVRRLAAAGMVLIGKTHMVQFAADILGINHDLGTPLNPWQAEPHLPGGSSSGSAVAVAAGLVPVAIGTDTGGSIRLPAGLCGITGFKPTVGRISRQGVYPLSWTLDVLGPMVRSVEDAVLVTAALQGPDPDDDATRHVPPIDGAAVLRDGASGLRVLLCETVFFRGASAGVDRAVRAAAGVLTRLGAEVRAGPLPVIDAADTHGNHEIIIATEAGLINRRFLEQHRAAVDPLGLWMAAGLSIPGSAYVRARRERLDLQRRFDAALGGIDALIVPTAPVPACPIAVADRDPGASATYVRNTAIGNSLNLPGLSVPCGMTAAGLPIGAMIYARPFDDAIVLRLGHAFQQATDWHHRRPDLRPFDRPAVD